MAKIPQYILEGFRPHGPGMCRCRCGKVMSTNAFVRSKHECPVDDFDPENIHGLASVRQSIEEDRCR